MDICSGNGDAFSIWEVYPGGPYYKGHWIWDRMFVVDMHSILPDSKNRNFNFLKMNKLLSIPAFIIALNALFVVNMVKIIQKVFLGVADCNVNLRQSFKDNQIQLNFY